MHLADLKMSDVANQCRWI